jgi:hypothetical protein
MNTREEQVIHIPVMCMLAAVDVLKQIPSQALVIGSDELHGTIAIKLSYDGCDRKSRKAIANLQWFKQSLDAYLKGNSILPPLT